MTDTPAIFFHPDAIEGKDRDLVGRRSAGQSFLKGFLRHTPGDRIRAVTHHLAAAKVFEDTARGLGETRELTVYSLRGQSDFTAAGCIFFPTPGYLNATWRRQRFGPEKCSLVGITHTMSTRRVIEGVHNLMAEPVEPWDAIICTSRAVHSVLARQLALEADYLRGRFGATRVPQPQLPIIPLGIHADDFTSSAGLRAEARAKYEVPEDAVVYLCVGRWTVIEKANPVPLFQALETVAGAAGRPVHLWMVGWASRPEEEDLHRKGAAQVCPSVTTRMIDGRDDWVRRAIWSGADIFTLPVDNVQETFGLVPVEAMAAGLPVVMPDWNGFRDTVVHGQTGMLIPTRMARPGIGDRIAERFADGTDDYVRYLSIVLQHTQIDVPAYTNALLALGRDAGMRARMGQAGRAHVQAHFDWAAVIPQYLALADHLADVRRGAVPTTPRFASGPVNPIEVDPFDLYAAYPTATLSPGTIVTPARPLSPADLIALDAVNGRTLYQRRAVPDQAMLNARAALGERGPMTVADLALVLNSRLHEAEAVVLFLAKFDIVRLPPLDPK